MLEKLEKDLEERKRLHEKIRHDQEAREQAARDRATAEQQAQQAAEQRKRDEEQAQRDAEQRQRDDEKRERDAELKARLEREQHEQQQRKVAAEKQAVDRDLASRGYGAPAAIAHADTVIAKVRDVKNTIDAQIKSNKAMFNEALRYRMQFTTKVGAVTNSRRHIREFAGEIGGLLAKGKQTSDLLYRWLLNNLGKQFVVGKMTCCAKGLNELFRAPFPSCRNKPRMKYR